jgi:hypothetical protein
VVVSPEYGSACRGGAPSGTPRHPGGEGADWEPEGQNRDEGRKFASHRDLNGHKSGPCPALCGEGLSVDVAVTYALIARPAKAGGGGNSRVAPATRTGCTALVSARLC